MRAVVQRGYGDTKVLELATIARPVPRGTEVLIRVHAVSLHAEDESLVRGVSSAVRFPIGWSRPSRHVPGISVAGVVEAVGSRVKDLKPGDAVFGECHGACAEFALGSENTLVAKPFGLSFAKAAAIPTSALAALRGLREAASVKRGTRVLIHAACGAVGMYAVQIAKAMGAEVTGVCSSATVSLVSGLGADHVIDYDDFVTGAGSYDVTFDGGADHFSPMSRVLTPYGVLMSNTGTPRVGATIRGLIKSVMAQRRNVRFGCSPNRNELLTLAGLINAGKLTTVIDRTFRLDQTPAAVAYVGAGHARGKVVIVVSGDTDDTRIGFGGRLAMGQWITP